MSLPAPLDRSLQLRDRYLSDNCIRAAIEQGVITVDPVLPEHGRIQPVSIDLRVNRILDGEHFGEDRVFIPSAPNGRDVLPTKYVSQALLSETFDLGQHDQRTPNFLGPRIEARSSVRRLGGFSSHSGYFFRQRIQDTYQDTIELGMNGPSSLIFDRDERLAQLLVRVFPFADDEYMMPGWCDAARSAELGEFIRSLPMGVQVGSNDELRAIIDAGYLEVSPSVTMHDGLLAVHASEEAYRMLPVEGGLDFSRRKEYAPEQLREPIDIRKGYEVKPYEHVIIETKESFVCSPHTAIIFVDTPISHSWRMRHTRGGLDPDDSMQNVLFHDLIDGLVDPGYAGGFSRQPKWMTGRRVLPGDVVGYGVVLYFPEPVGTAYGDTSLGSQYQGKQKTRFAK